MANSHNKVDDHMWKKLVKKHCVSLWNKKQCGGSGKGASMKVKN